MGPNPDSAWNPRAFPSLLGQSLLKGFSLVTGKLRNSYFLVERLPQKCQGEARQAASLETVLGDNIHVIAQEQPLTGQKPISCDWLACYLGLDSGCSNYQGLHAKEVH